MMLVRCRHASISLGLHRILWIHLVFLLSLNLVNEGTTHNYHHGAARNCVVCFRFHSAALRWSVFPRGPQHPSRSKPRATNACRSLKQGKDYSANHQSYSFRNSFVLINQEMKFLLIEKRRSTSELHDTDGTQVRTQLQAKHEQIQLIEDPCAHSQIRHGLQTTEVECFIWGRRDIQYMVEYPCQIRASLWGFDFCEPVWCFYVFSALFQLTS